MRILRPRPQTLPKYQERHDAGIGLLDVVVPAGGVVLLWYSLVEAVNLPSAIGMLNAGICLQQLASSVRHRSGGPVTLTFWAFSLVWLGVAPLAQLQAAVLPWPDARMSGYFVAAQLITTIALLSYAVGGFLGRKGRRMPSTLGDPRCTETIVVTTSYKRIWIPFCIAIALSGPVLLFTGGVTGRFANRDEVGSAFAQSGISAAGGDTIQLFFLNRLPAAAALVAAYAGTHYYFQYVRHRNERYLPPLLLLLLGLLLVLLLANPFSSSRYIAFGALAAIILAIVRIDTPARRVIFATVSVIGLIVIYPLATWFKRDDVRSSVLRGMPDMFYTVDFDGFQQIINSVYFVEEYGHTFGRYVVSALFFFVPRAIWDGKAMPASLDVAASRGYEFQNLSMPVWSEFFIDFGIVGVIAGLGIMGYVAAGLDRAYFRSPRSTASHICVLFAVCQFGLLRGPLGAQVVFVGSVLIIGYLVFRRGNSSNAERSGVK